MVAGQSLSPSFVHGKAAPTSNSAAQDRPRPAQKTQEAEAHREAQRLLQQAHAKLLSRRSIRAEIAEVAALTSPPLRLTGRYVSSGIRLRLEYEVQLPGGVTGSLTEVCDGERLWSLMELPGSQRITRRDVRQILAAVEQSQLPPEKATIIDLALGGLPAFLSSLQRSLHFHSVERKQQDEQELIVLSGTWNDELAAQLGKDAKKPKYPPHIPEAVRLYLAADSLFPVRLVYLKRHDQELKMLVDLRFRQIEFDGPVDERLFAFTPPDSTEPEDITREYLQLLQTADKTQSAPAAP